MLNDTSNVNDDTANEKNVTNNDRVIVDEHQQLLCLDNVCDKKHKQIVCAWRILLLYIILSTATVTGNILDNRGIKLPYLNQYFTAKCILIFKNILI